MDSANIVFMNSVEGQPNDWNFFSKEFVNHIPTPTSAQTIALSAKFASVTKYIQQVGLSEMAHFDQHGKESGTTKFPFSLRFVPHEDVHSLFPTDLPGTDPLAYVGQLESVPENKNLYYVYGMDKPKELGGTETMIGTF